MPASVSPAPSCGHCCTGEPGFVWVDDADLAALAEHRGETIEQVRGLYTRGTPRGRTLREKTNGDCVFYDKTGRLHRLSGSAAAVPHLAVLGEQRRRSPEAWQATCEVCPGAGQGELIPAEEITRRLKIIRL